MNLIARTKLIPAGSPLLNRLPSIIDLVLNQHQIGIKTHPHGAGSVLISQNLHGRLDYHAGASVRQHEPENIRDCAEKKSLQDFDKRRQDELWGWVGWAVATIPKDKCGYCRLHGYRAPCAEACRPMIMGRSEYYPELPFILVDPSRYTPEYPAGIHIVSAGEVMQYPD